jgi:hypothetical protein
MMNRAMQLHWTIRLTIGLLTLAAPAGAADDIVTVAGTNVADICVSCLEPRVRIAVTPAKPDLKASDVKLAVIEVALGNQKFNIPERVFSAEWEQD